MSAPNNYEDSLRVHDKAVYDWLSTLLVDYGDMNGVLTSAKNGVPILKVFSTPQRSFATIVDLLVNLNWVTGATAADMRATAEDFAVLPLPFVTIERDEPIPDTELSGVPKTMRQQLLNQVTQQWVDHPFPSHYKTDYRLTIWSNKKYTEAFIKEWLYSKLGNLGASHNECFIPVTHAQPWGTWIQSFKFNGSSNLSDLEGEEQRFMRFEYSFTLRTWIMKNPPAGNTPLDRIGRIYENGNQAESDLIEERGDVDTTSMNMFLVPYTNAQIPMLWPKNGNATVRRSYVAPPESFQELGLNLTVLLDTDNVELLTRPILINSGHAIVSVAFEYKSDQDTNLALIQTNPTTNVSSLVYRVELPASSHWKKVHIFTVVTQPLFTVQIEGNVGAVDLATVDTYGIDIRHLNNLTPLAGPTTFVGVTHTEFVWSSLASEPYLVIGIVVAAVASGVIEVRDDLGAPLFTTSQSIDASVNAGFVALIQPRTTTVVAKIPNSLGIASIRLQRYDGPYKGNEI